MIRALQTGFGVRILGADDNPRPGPWEKPSRRLTWYLLVCSLEGSEEITIASPGDGASLRIRPGESYLIAPGVAAALKSTSGNRPVWVHFDVVELSGRGPHPPPRTYEDDWAERKAWAQPSPREVWGVDLPVRVPTLLHRKFADELGSVVKQWREGHDQAVMESRHRLEGLMLAWTRLERRVGNAGGLPAKERIERAELLAREHVGGLFGVKEFAAAAGLSRTRFSVLYQRERGRGPGEFLRTLRLEEAARLLRRTALDVAAIARTCGYADSGVFGRAFRQAFGKSPGLWRREERAP